MPAAMTEAQAYARLSQLTGMTEQKWRDFLRCAPDEQALIVEGFALMSWSLEPDVLAEVLSILAVLASIAGAVAGISGAISAVQALGKS